MQRVDADVETAFHSILEAKKTLTQEVERHDAKIRDLRAVLEQQNSLARRHRQELQVKTDLIQKQESKIEKQASIIRSLRENLRADHIELDDEDPGTNFPVVDDQEWCGAHSNKIQQLEKMLIEEYKHSIEQEEEIEYLRATAKIRGNFFREFFVETSPVDLKELLLLTARQINALSSEWEAGRRRRQEE
jgi:hypothetical protein